jgi:hypothetical protein
MSESSSDTETEQQPAPEDVAPESASGPPHEASRIHAACRRVFEALTEFISVNTIPEVAKKMGVWKRNHLMLHGEENGPYLSIFVEYVLIDYEKNGKTALERFVAMHKPDPSSEAGIIMQALGESPLTGYQVTAHASDSDLELTDLSNGLKHVVYEPDFVSKLPIGTVVLTRLLSIDARTTTTGHLVVLMTEPGEIPPDFPAANTKQQARKRAAMVLRPLFMAIAAHSHDEHGHHQHH